jgi:hypothetical protein
MKMSDINVGDTIVIGRSHGSRGVMSTGVRAEVLEVGVAAEYSWRKANYIRVVVLDSEGNRKLRDNGELSTRSLRGQEVLSLADAARRDEEARELEERRKLIYRTVEARQNEIAMAVEARLGVAPTVRGLWNEEEGRVVIREVEFRTGKTGTLDALLTLLGMNGDG